MKHTLRISLLALVLPSLLAACSPGAANLSSASRSAPASTSPPSDASDEPAATEFASDAYGYTVTLPARWFGRQAAVAWGGTGSPDHAGPYVDQWVGPAAPVAWATAAATSADLPAYAAGRASAGAAAHPCPAVPETEDAITVDGEPAILQVVHCPANGGILVMAAYAIHRGVGFDFLYQDRLMRAGDPGEGDDRAAFLAMLDTISLPD